MRFKNAEDDIAYHNYQKDSLNLKEPVSIPRSKLCKDIPNELLDNELKQELNACKEDDSDIKYAIQKEY
jgi:hypothetical protein